MSYHGTFHYYKSDKRRRAAYCQCQYNRVSSKTLFQSALDEVALHNYQSGPNADTRRDIGGLSLGTQLAGSTISQDQGAVKQTGQASDFALLSEGYFVVQNNAGQRLYTRNGDFTVNQQNQYVTQEGYLVLGANGQAVSALGPTNFQIQTFPRSIDYSWSKLCD